MSVNRKSLLIANPGIEGSDKYCSGVIADIKNFKDFLLSPIGGLWKDEEIIIKNKPSKAELLNSINLLKNTEYALIVFSGHGWHSSQLNETMLQLNDKEDINSKELRQGAPKQTLILDCCRVICKELLEKILEYAFQKTLSQIHPEDCRLYYDNRIKECPGSLTVLYSCDINETAGETSKGGYFSYSLINSSKEWASRTTIDTTKECSIFSIVQAFEKAQNIVREVSGKRQNPQIEKPRSEKYFPFCIIA
jgi:hypothetical protein